MQIALTHTKGNDKWDKQVLLCGNIDSRNTGDFVFCLEEHFLKNFNLSLKDFRNWNLSQEQRYTKIWRWSEEGCRTQLKSMAFQAG